MRFLNFNPYNFLLLGVTTGYLLAAILTWMVLKLYGLKGLLLGIITNAIVHTTLIICNELISRARMPFPEYLIRSILVFSFFNLLFSGGTYLIMKIKKRPPELLATIAFLISSFFSWEFFIPTIFALVVLLIPSKE